MGCYLLNKKNQTMKLKLLTIALLFSFAVAAQEFTPVQTLNPIANKLSDENRIAAMQSKKPKDTIDNKSPLFSITDFQTFVNRLRPLIADKLTVKEWDSVVNYVNALTEQKLKEANKEKAKTSK